jgi:hypothetical protein
LQGESVPGPRKAPQAISKTTTCRPEDQARSTAAGDGPAAVGTVGSAE